MNRPPLAVITGGASGIGLETCRLLADRGYAVAVADLNLAGATETADQIGALGGRAQAFQFDLAHPDRAAELRVAVVDAMGVPAVVANVAGWNAPEPFLANTVEHHLRMIAINLLGPTRVSHEFLTAMVGASQGGRLINVASDAGRIGNVNDVVYGAAKGGVIALTKGLAREMARHRITVNCVCPGPTDTPMFRAGVSDDARDKVAGLTPLRRLGLAEEIASAIAFFASDEAAYVTGQVLSVSGGLTMAG